MEPILAVAIIFIIFALGDVVATKTRAIISMLFIASVIFLVVFWTFLPSTMFADSTLLSVGGIMVTMLLVHMGSNITIRDFIDQWKTVVVSALACAGICLSVYFIGGLVIDRGYALVGAPILSGGVVATLTMQEAATAAGRTDLAVFATLVMVAQGFVGYPVASLCLRSEAKRIQKLVKEGKLTAAEGAAASAALQPKKRLLPQIPAKYNGPNMIIAKLAIVGFIATWLSQLTGGAVNKLVVCLILGVLCKEIGFVDENAFNKANSFGIVLSVVTLAIFTNLASATPEMVMSMVGPLLVVIVIGVICFAGISIIVGKLFKFSWQMSTAIGSTCLFGFPGTFIVTHEVVGSLAENEAEKKIMLDSILPKMLIAGMVTVSVASVIFAGAMAAWL